MTDLKYLNCVYKITPQMKGALEEVPRRSGFYNWMFVFKGEIAAFHDIEDFEKYDVVQVNLSPVDQVMIREIRKMIPRSSSTLLIGNNDYVTESWDEWGSHPMEWMQVQEELDGLFGTEPYQTSFLREDAHIIPHPTPVHHLKRIGNDDLDTQRMKVGGIYHWWHGGTYHTSYIFEKLRKLYPRLQTRLYAHGDNGMGKSKNARWLKVMFDKTMPMMNHPDYIRSLMTNRFVADLCPYHTYGRTTVDTAALRIPSVGSDRIFSMKHNFPELCTDPYDAREQLRMMDKILKGGEWLEEQMDLAYENVEYFNYKNSKDRYLAMVDDIRDRRKK